MDIEPFIRYLKIERSFSAHTVTAYSGDLIQFRDYASTTYGMTDVQSLTRDQIRSWIVELMDADINAASIARKISSLNSYLRFRIRQGELKKNPAFGLTLPKKSKRLPKFVPESGMNGLLDGIAFADDYHGDRDKMIIELFYFTGMREAELMGLKKSDIDVYNQQVKVTGKRNKERLIPVTQVFAEQLKGFIERSDQQEVQDNEYLFVTDTGKKLYPKFVYNLVNRYLSQVAGVTQKSPHILRHSFATHMLNRGADINAIKTILGHTSLAATQVYTHNTIEKLKDIHKQAHPRG
ncbi:MAG: tyrosine-type recombinase/integrase [Bacteroidota bacterium]